MNQDESMSISDLSLDNSFKAEPQQNVISSTFPYPNSYGSPRNEDSVAESSIYQQQNEESEEVEVPASEVSEDPFEAQQLQLLNTLGKCQGMFFMFAIMFFGLAIMSIVEYCMIWKKYTEDDLFVLMCIFQNLLHSHFFAIELNHIINKRVNALRDYEQDPVNEFQEQYVEINLQNVIVFLFNKRLQLYKVNQTVFSVMFVIGFSKLFNQNNLADLWFMVAELSLGVLFFGAFVMVLLGLCLATPVLFCYLYWRRHREEIDLQVMLVEQSLPDIQVDLPQAVAYSTLTTTNTQPCYICLQDYEVEELVIELPCNAKHIFHEECIQPWVDLHPRCPVCRQNLY